MNDDWIKDIQRLMSDHEAKAPDGLLDDIKAEMAAKPSVKTSRIVSLWRYRWIAAAVAVAIIAVPVVWQLLPQTQMHSDSITMRSDGASMRSDGAPMRSDGAPAVAATAPISSPIALVHSPIATTNIPAVAEGGDATMRSDGAPAVAATAPANSATAPANSTTAPSNSQTAPSTTPTTANHRQNYDNENLFAYESPRHSTSKGFSLTAYYGGSTGSGSTAGFSGRELMAAADPYGTYTMDMSGTNSKGFLDRPQRKAHHNQPIKVGVSVGYRLSDRWSVNTGVTYSYLSTEITEEGRASETQKLHYVGIPFTVSYSFVKGKKVEVYVTGGGEVEKLVKGRTEYGNYEDEKITEKRPQWSVKAAVGGAWHFTPTVSVFAEPGVSYYFDNHSDVENVYKDHKTSFSLNIGLRLNVNSK